MECRLQSFDLIIVPICEFDSRWKIRARCFSKGPVRPLPMCSFDFVDASGEIRAVAFRDECTRFHPIVEVDKVYHFSIFPSQISLLIILFP